ncbi:flagellar hook-basal body protein [Acetoanaerobium noterae]|uniref:flagellar hook-basal body protein n=1 Tax=Acetoanaerobium noterae TaxID=745369 RepID=UPI0032429497
MFRGIYTATNGMRTDSKRIDVITSNIANSQTTAFKKDVLVTESFPEQLMVKLNGVENNLRPTRQLVNVDPPADFQTNDSIVSIEITSGYLRMEDRHGIGYHKSAKITRDEEGYLRTALRDSDSNTHAKFGAYLLDVNGNPISAPDGALTLLPNGILQAGGQDVARIITAVNAQVIGTMNGGALADRSMINFNQGNLDPTENPLHVAIEGKGFFKILDMQDNQIKYSRNGGFSINPEGILVDYSGNVVLSASDNEISVPEGASKIDIDKFGNIVATIDGEPEEIDTLGVVNIANTESMIKQGESYLTMADGIEADEAEFDGQVLQGYLEGSNVDIISEMAEMINLLRGYESGQKVIRSYDDIMSKAANEIGKI